MSRRIALALVAPATIVLLTSCSGAGMSSAAVDACNTFASQMAEDPPPDRRADVAERIAGDVDRATEQELKDAHRELEAAAEGTDAEWTEATDHFSATCSDLGWDLPEG